MCAVKCKQQELFLHSLQCMQTVLEVMVPPTVLALQVSQPELSTSCVSFCCYCFITGIFLWCILMLLLLFHAFMLIDNASTIVLQGRKQRCTRTIYLHFTCKTILVSTSCCFFLCFLPSQPCYYLLLFQDGVQ